MSSGGGGQSGQTRYDWNDVIGSYWGGKPGANGQGGGGVLGWASQEAMRPYQSFGNRVAGQNTDQYTGMQRVRDMANSGGPTDTMQGRMAAGNIAGGGALTANPYMGDNPYFRKNLASSMEDVTNAYNKGTAQQTNALMNMSGVLGGGDHQKAVANNQDALARNLSRMGNEAYGAQFDKSANMYESALGRQMQAIPLAFQGQGLSTDMNNQLMGVGQQNQDYQQKLIDQNYNNWAEQNNWGRNNVNWLASLLGGAQGSTGIQTQFGGYAPTNYGSQAVGLGMLGKAAGLF